MTAHTPADDAFDALLRPLKIIIAALAAMLAGGLIAGAVLISSLRANDRAILAQRNEARLTVCTRDNKQSDDAVVYARGQAQVLIDASFRGRAPSPSDQERAAAFLAAAGEEARKLFPKRDCSPEAIDDYYKQAAK